MSTYGPNGPVHPQGSGPNPPPMPEPTSRPASAGQQANAGQDETVRAPAPLSGPGTTPAPLDGPGRTPAPQPPDASTHVIGQQSQPRSGPPPQGYQPGYVPQSYQQPGYPPQSYGQPAFQQPGYQQAGYPSQQGRPAQPYPGQAYPAQGQPAQGYAAQGYATQQPQWPGGPQPRKRSRAIIVLSIVLAVIVIAGVTTGIVVATGGGSATAAPKPPAPNSCVNADSGPPVMMVPADCSAASYQVVKVLTGTNDKTSCAGVAGVTNYYLFTWPPDGTEDYVLCLRKKG